MTNNVADFLASVNEAALQCAILCRKVQGEMLSSMDKSDSSPVTIADYGCQALIHRAILLNHPEHALISEEGSDHLRKNAAPGEISAIVRLVSDALGNEVTISDICGWIDHRGPAHSEYIGLLTLSMALKASCAARNMPWQSDYYKALRL